MGIKTNNVLIKPDDIINAVLSGIKSTQNKYKNWVNRNISISWGPEYLLTTYIAESIFESAPKFFVKLEESTYNTMRESGSKTRLSNNKRTLTGRADIIVLDNDLPKYIVEVKNRVNRLENIHDDLDRLSYMVSKEKGATSIEYGMMAFLIDVDYDVKSLGKNNCVEKLDQKIQTIFQNAQGNKRYGQSIKEYYYESFEEPEYDYSESKKRIWGWAAVVFVIRPN